ncbi:hypothetical protein DE146DRAFT_761602 [Phaeosphaeria sp. MPI-PUGE-AT-0046c]|nr:hypothetical protein DE146DRAFT_761602 [Phaeosphaeria sp. MPI-PUGE-AT-0046c]
MARCIFQDDLSDWRHEAERMRDIYRNSALCIAATAAHNGNEGLFHDWNEDPRFLVESGAKGEFFQDDGHALLYLPKGTYKCSFHPASAEKVIDSSPLNSRVWVAQERYLSPRVVHFTQAGLFWDCPTSFIYETHPTLQTACCKWSDHKSLKQLTNEIKSGLSSVSTRDQFDSDRIYRSWLDFRHFYTQCSMTRKSDVLIALRGIALDICGILKDKLVFGLWQKRLIEDLSWYQRTSGPGLKLRRSYWRAPSWSWASSAGHIRRRVTDIRGRREVVEILRHPIERDNAADWQLHSIFLRCRLISLRI